MKMKTTNWCKIIFVAVFAFFATACSDGALPDKAGGLGDLGAPMPLIVKFFAAPEKIKAGEATTIHWKVADADSIEIKPVMPEGGTPIDFHVQSKELEGEARVEKLDVTTDFILTVTKSAVSAESEKKDTKSKAATTTPDKPGAPAKPAGPSAVSKTITVTVEPKLEVVATITADPTKIRSGDQVLLRWNVTPAENMTVAVTADTSEPIVAFTKCDGTKEEIVKGEVVTTIPAVGCAIATPATTTIYTVSGKTADGIEGNASATVNVSETGINATIKVNGSSMATLQNFSEPVTVEWTVEPATAKVTISSEPAVECTPALGKMEKAKGSASCIVDRNTAFTVTAELGDKKDDDTARVVRGGAGAALDVSEKWAFEGETVSVDLAVSKGTDPTAIQSITLNGAALKTETLDELKRLGTVRVPNIRVGKLGVEAILTTSGGTNAKYKLVRVVELATKALDSGVAAVTSVTFDETLKHRYSGVMMSGYNKGVVRFYIDGGMREFNAVEKIKAVSNLTKMWNDNFFTNVIKTFPTVIAARSGKPDEIYAGTTGLVMRSIDGGKGWKEIWVGRVQAGSGFKGEPSHPSCGYDSSTKDKQKVQGGIAPQYDGGFISLTQVCDILALKDGKVILATDVGIRTVKNIDDTKIEWLGGKVSKEGQSPTLGVVVNDLELAGDSKIFAAAASGMFVSEDGGVTWKKFGSGLPTGSVFSVASDEKNIYAGTASGLFVATLDKDEFTAITGLSKPVLAIAVDSSDATVILVGTDSDVQVSRDGGATWSSIDVGTKKPVASLTLKTTLSEDSASITCGVAIGTDKGELSAIFDLPNNTIGRPIPLKTPVQTVSTINWGVVTNILKNSPKK